MTQTKTGAIMFRCGPPYKAWLNEFARESGYTSTVDLVDFVLREQAKREGFRKPPLALNGAPPTNRNKQGNAPVNRGVHQAD